MNRVRRWWKRLLYRGDGVLRGRDSELFTLKTDLNSARAELGRVTNDRQKMAEDYYELLGAVSKKWTGESRHQTALRYIMEAERRGEGEGQCPEA